MFARGRRSPRSALVPPLSLTPPCSWLAASVVCSPLSACRLGVSLFSQIAATWDGTSANPSKRELALYVDGVLEQSGTEDDDDDSVSSYSYSYGMSDAMLI